MKPILALIAALALLLALASCGKAPQPEVTQPDTTTAGEVPVGPATQPDTETTESGETSAEVPGETTTGEDGSTQAGETTQEGESTKAGATTTKPAPTSAPKKPATKAEIVAYYNTALRKVKADKPGYTTQERTVIDSAKISSSSGFIKTVAPPVIRMAKGIWEKWTDPAVQEKGSDHSGMCPHIEVQPDWVKAASCTESNGIYYIRIYLIDERVRELPERQEDTMHGKLVSCFTKSQITDGAGSIGVDISKFDCLYSGSYIDCTVNKATGAMIKQTTHIEAQVDMVAKLGVTLDASLPIAQERAYIF